MDNTDPEMTMPLLTTLLRNIAKNLTDIFQRATVDLKPTERDNLGSRGHEILGVLFYHLYRKFPRESLARQRDELTRKGTPSVKVTTALSPRGR
ncbi:hypothetical protein DFAR_1390024 [Desulfarculales bacterium]